MEVERGGFMFHVIWKENLADVGGEKDKQKDRGVKRLSSVGGGEFRVETVK